jgi:pimeloyl-ACP methyl ester carboxylesterase
MKLTRIAWHGKMRLAALAAAMAVAGLLIPAAQAASAHPSVPAATGSQPKPSIVLVHGAWADSSSWDAEVSQLQHDGYPVYVPTNPLQGLHYDSAYLADFLHSIAGPIILVGHSYGGAVITNAATGDQEVKALVYVDAFAPARGETLAQLVTAKPGSCVVPANLTLVPYPRAPQGAADAYIKQSVFPSCMANDLPASQGRVLAALQPPLTTLALTQKSGVPAWKTIPSWAIIGTADHAIPPAELLAMARRAHSHVTFIPGGSHLSMISNPCAVTNVILQAAQATT